MHIFTHVIINWEEIVKEKIVKTVVFQPEMSDYKRGEYKHISCSTEQDKKIFKLLTEDSELINRILITVEEAGGSPIGYYEKHFQKAIQKGELSTLSNHDKQLAGAIVAVIMLANGWKKTGKKQRFSKGLFTTAEIYKK